MKITAIIFQTALLIIFAPLVSGLIRKLKNTIRMRRGAGIFQPYYNFFKLLGKEEVISENASWIFRITPYVVIASVVTAALLVPIVIPSLSIPAIGDFLLFFFLLALGRFFLSLAGLDAGSSFGGMGSSREMFISSLVEPAAFLAVFAVSIKCGSTSLGVISASQTISLSTIIASVSLFTVILAETSRIPVDNQETHLELTMVHEAMALEYSGPSLAIIEAASHVKQILFFTLAVNILLPIQPAHGPAFFLFTKGLLVYLAKIAGIIFAVSLVEVSFAKMRLFRVADFLAFSFVLSCIAVITAVMGF